MNSNNQMRILITGGGGFLGKSIAKLLLANNYKVVSFSRSHYKELDDIGVEQISGDLRCKADIHRALQNIDAVIHTASKVGMNGRYQDFYEINYEGTKNLVAAMKELKINKLIFTSTPSVVFGTEDINNGDESLPYPKKYLTHYAHTKMLAEDYIIKNSDHTFQTISLRPHLIFGPDDQNLIPRLLKARADNRLKIVGDGTNLVDVIYVENAALAHLMALQKLNSQLSGKTYFIGQGPVNLWNFINSILQHFNMPPVTKKIPIKIAYAIGAVIEFILTIFRLHQVHPPMSRFIALQLGKSHYFSHENSLRDLGNYHQISIEDAIKLLINNNTGRRA